MDAVGRIRLTSVTRDVNLEREPARDVSPTAVLRPGQRL